MKSEMIMIFDTETTGLVPNWTYNIPLDNLPYITQLSYVLYNEKTRTIEKTFDHYIKLPEHVEIPQIVTEITGLTKQICDEKGVALEYCLTQFYKDLHKCGKVIAHNISFDEKMIYISFRRHWNDLVDECPYAFMMFNEKYLKINKKEKICTMITTIDYCKIPRGNNSNSNAYKWPKLSELHDKLFGYVPENLHNSIIDVLVCLRCYLKLNDYVITSRVFSKMISAY